MALISHSFTANFGPFVLLICWLVAQVEAQSGSLPQDEVEALRKIAEEIGNKNWNFNGDPCNHPSKSLEQSGYNNSISCNCTALNGVCHVVSILIKRQNVSGVLPPSIVKLPHLKILDLYANHLTGNIPPQWASTSLETLTIAVNRLTGEIPSFLGNITSLVNLNIENNLFSGTVPPELGNLVNLQYLFLSSNNLSGEIPLALSNMSKLIELRISSNNFIGKIPGFIQSWKHLSLFEIQGSGLEGPIPSSISQLNNLTDLRISDLQGEGSVTPVLLDIYVTIPFLLDSKIL